MPRRVKILPDKRADYSFGDLVYWHLFIFGTYPKCDPSAKIGVVWEAKGFCALMRISERTLWNWILDRHLPDHLLDIEAVLFADNPQLHDWRIELWRALRAGRLLRASKARFGVGPSEESEDVSDDPSASAEAEDSATDEAEDRAHDAGDTAEDAEGEKVHLPARYSPEEKETHDGPVLDLPAFRREETKGSQESGGGPIDLVMLQRQRKERSSTRQRTNRRRAAIGFLVPGVMLLLGVYSWSRPSPSVSVKEVVQIPPKPEIKPPPKPEEKKSVRVLTEQERREAEERATQGKNHRRNESSQ